MKSATDKKIGGAKLFALRMAMLSCVAVIGTGSMNAVLHADVIATSASDFAVFSGANVSTGNNVTINGMVGAGGDLYLNNNNTVTGTSFSGGNLNLGNNVTAQNLISNNAIWINNNSSAGTISAGTTAGLSQNASSDSIRAGGNVTISQNAAVNGSISTSGSVNVSNNASVTQGVSFGTTYWADKKAQVNGSVMQTNNPAAPDSWTRQSLGNPGITNSKYDQLYYSPSTTASLVAGTYGNLVMDHATKLTLTAGIYNFQSMSIGEHALINVDSSKGDVIINVAGNVSTGESVTFANLSKGSLALQSAGSLYLGTENVFNGNLKSYSTMTIDEESSINGSLCSSQDLYLGNNVNVTYFASSAATASNAMVPEPASLSVLVLGSLMLMRRQRRENTVG